MTSWKKNMMRIFAISTWCAIGAGGIVLLIAAIQKRNQQVCTGYKIEISGVEEQLFMDEKKIGAVLFGKGTPINKLVSSFDLRKMERNLEENIWVKDAQLFFDNNEKLQVRVHEREPIARVFTIGGNTFYIDSSGARLPLTDNQAAHLVAFTNFPVEKGRLKRTDSLLLRQMVEMSTFIGKSEFWSAQVQQIDITPNKTFELIPLIGNHQIVFGKSDNIEEKFERLFLFYKQVMSRTGFDLYEKLDVQYAGQVVATRKAAPLSRKDSLLAVQKVKQLIAEAQQLQPDTLMQAKVRPIEKSDVTEQTLTNYDLLPMKTDTGLAETPKDPVPLKTFIEKASTQNTSRKDVKKQEKKNSDQKTKAVMEKRGF